MKTSRLALSLIISFAMYACDDHTEGVAPATVTETSDSPTADEAVEDDTPAEEPDGRTQLTVDIANSTFGFTGAKITDSHSGQFGEWSGDVRLGDTIEESAVNITIQMASVEADRERLTRHLRSDDFFDVAQFPTATFASTAIAASEAEGATHTVTGTLNLHGVERSISFPATIELDESGVHARAEFQINRQEFGITYPGMPDDLIRDEVVIRFDIRAPRG